MKKAISNIAWTAQDDHEIYTLLSEFGVTAIEAAPNRLVADNPYDNISQGLEVVRKLKNEYNLDVVSLQAICFGRSEAIFGSAEEKSALMQYIKKAIDFASAIKCGNIVFGSPKNRIIGDGQHGEAIDFFSEIGLYSEQRNVTFAIEPNPVIYGTNFLNTTAEAIEFVKECNVGGLKINFDCGTAIYNDENLKELADNINLVSHVHISEPYLEPIQERIIHKELADILKMSGYTDYVSIEMKSGQSIEQIKNILRYFDNAFN